MIHTLKIEPEYFQAVLDDTKTFEVRKEDDKHFEVGDTLILREWKEDLEVYGMDAWDALLATKDADVADTLRKHLDARGYTGRSCRVTVIYILRDERWLLPGVAVLGIRVEEDCYCQEELDGCDPTRAIGCPLVEENEGETNDAD